MLHGAVLPKPLLYAKSGLLEVLPPCHASVPLLRPFDCRLRLCYCAQILQLYKDYIDPEFTWSNFSVEEQAKVIVAPRSNNLLDTDRVGHCPLSHRSTKGAALRQYIASPVAPFGTAR